MESALLTEKEHEAYLKIYNDISNDIARKIFKKDPTSKQIQLEALMASSIIKDRRYFSLKTLAEKYRNDEVLVERIKQACDIYDKINPEIAYLPVPEEIKNKIYGTQAQASISVAVPVGVAKPKKLEIKKIEAKKVKKAKVVSPYEPFNQAAVLVPTAISALGCLGVLAGSYVKAYLTEKAAEEYANFCKDEIKIGKIEKIVKDYAIAEQTFYVNAAEADSIEPGYHRLIELVDSTKIDSISQRIKNELAGVLFKVEEIKEPFSPPLKNCKWGSPFGDPRPKGGPRIHTGYDCSNNGGRDTIYASADGIVSNVNWGRISGLYVTIKHGKTNETDDGLEINIMDGEKFVIPVESLRCIFTAYNKKGKPYQVLGNKEISYFNNKPISTLYCHCSKVLVKRGQTVKRGQPIAIEGTTGRVIPALIINAKGDTMGYYKPIHVHYAVKMGEIYVDPMFFISEEAVKSEFSKLWGIKCSLNSILDKKIYYKDTN